MPERTRLPLHPVSRVHLDELAGPLGIWQHAVGRAPDPRHGYCADDVARALMVDLRHGRELGWPSVAASARHAFEFLFDAFDPAAGTFRNFRAADGRWEPSTGSQDSQGRVVLAVGAAMAEAQDATLRADAGALFRRALTGARRLTSFRSVASAILGCDLALARADVAEVRTALRLLADRLRRAFAAAGTDTAWPWPDPVLTYENALLPRALLVAGDRLADDRLRRLGFDALDWLLAVQTGADGSFAPIGSDGWWPNGGVRARFDQQPIEATATILAAGDALRLSGDVRYRIAAEAAYGWFLGANDVGLSVADPATGGCHDGVAEDHLNTNQGAESTLMWNLALEAMRELRLGVGAAPAVSVPTRLSPAVPLPVFAAMPAGARS